MAPSAHSRLGASKAHRWMNCAGSPREEAKYPDSTNEWAELGTAAHELGEWCLENNQDPDARMGDMIKVESGNEYEVDEEMVEAVQVYVDVIREDMATIDSPEVFIEHKFHLAQIHDDLWGTNDCMVIEVFGKMYVYDYKHGMRIVEVHENPQLKIYGRGGMEGNCVEEVEIVIVQPRAFHPEGPVRRQLIKAEDLIDWGDTELKEAAERCDDPNALLTAGPWCHYCLAEAECATNMGKVAEVINFDPVELSNQDVSVPSASLPSVDALTPQQMGDIVKNKTIVTDWLKAIEQKLDDLVRANTPDTGFKIVHGRASRYWEDEDQALTFLQDYDVDPYKPQAMVTPAQAEKLIKKSGGNPADLKHLIGKRHGEKLVPNSEKGQALTFEVDFDTVE